MSKAGDEPRNHPGSCHCGAVRFEVVLDASAGTRCNCSVCNKIGLVMGIVKPDAFRLLSGESSLLAYEWGAKTGQRYFCKSCGVSVFSRGNLPQIGGAYVGVSYNALDDVDPADVKVSYWDGRHNNWQGGARDTPWPINA
jgi:hypothetical protein